MDEGEFAGDKNAMIMNDKIVRTSADPLHPLWLLLCAWNFTLCQADSMSNCVPIVIHLVPYFSLLLLLLALFGMVHSITSSMEIK